MPASLSLPSPLWLRLRGSALAALTVIASLSMLAALTACGGGGSNTPSAGGASSASAYVSGPITGLGSIIVNGVRLDDSQAIVIDDNDERRSAAQLKLGSYVEVQAVRLVGSTGTASVIRLGNEIEGPVSAIDVATNTFTVLGQLVEVVTGSTAFDTTLANGLASLTVGAVVDVHAQWDSTRSLYVATRVSLASASSSHYEVRGAVSQLDTAAKTFAIGSATFNYAQVSSVPAALANDAVLKVRVATTPVNNQWVVTGFAKRGRHGDAPSGSQGHVRGVVSAWTSARSFTLNGMTVDASNATFPEGETGVILGAWVEVEGTVSNGVLTATSVHLEDARGRGRSGHHHDRNEFHGLISAVDTAAKTFVVRGVTVSYTDATTWDDGTVAGLIVGARIEVYGALSADGLTITATRISFE